VIDADANAAAGPDFQILGLTSDEFVLLYRGKIVHDGIGGERGALRAYRQLFRTGAVETTGAEGLRVLPPPIVQLERDESPEGTVVKFVSRLQGESVRGAPADVESVLIPMIGSTHQLKYTLCVSSQIGCAMGCGFCETAQMGLIRSLTPAEIVSQWWNARHVVGFEVSNIVFMGMGEPMDNFDNVMNAIAVLKDHNGPHVAISKISISTVGRVDGIRRMAAKIQEPGWHRLSLALSLNAPNDEVRSSIMPVNRRWPLADLKQALYEWPRYAGNKLCIEYVLIPGVNDAPEHLDQVAEFMSIFRKENGKTNAILNLIPYNPRRNSPWPAPEESHVAWFLAGLIERGVFAKRRRTKGRDMMGACGQLGAAHIRQRKLVQPTISA
jgi:23S rRNA (adenine2503-C2)-methyltransferase